MKTQLKLLWDGSYLGEYPVKCKGRKLSTHGGLAIHQIKTDSFVTRCAIKAFRNTSLPVLLDEFKTCFNIKKTGTHRIKIGGRVYVMIRCTLQDKLLSKFPKKDINDHIRNQMKHYIAYRTIFSIPNTQNSSFIVRKEQIFSYYEPKTLIDKRSIEPSEGFLRNWLGKEDLYEIISEIFSIKEDETWCGFLFRLRNEIENIIKRVDNNYVWLCGLIIEKITKLRSETED